MEIHKNKIGQYGILMPTKDKDIQFRSKKDKEGKTYTYPIVVKPKNQSADASALSASASNPTPPSEPRHMEFSDDILNLIREYAKPHRQMTQIVDFDFVMRRLENEAGFNKLVKLGDPEVVAEEDKLYEQFINRIIEIGGNPDDYVRTYFRGGNTSNGIYYRKPTKELKYLFKINDRKATATFKKDTGLDRMVTTTNLEFTFPSPIGVGGEWGFIRTLDRGGGKENEWRLNIDEKERDKLMATSKYKKFRKDAEKQGWYMGIDTYGLYRDWHPEQRDWNEFLNSLSMN